MLVGTHSSYGSCERLAIKGIWFSVPRALAASRPLLVRLTEVTPPAKTP